MRRRMRRKKGRRRRRKGRRSYQYCYHRGGGGGGGGQEGGRERPLTSELVRGSHPWIEEPEHGGQPSLLQLQILVACHFLVNVHVAREEVALDKIVEAFVHANGYELDVLCIQYGFQDAQLLAPVPAHFSAKAAKECDHYLCILPKRPYFDVFAVRHCPHAVVGDGQQGLQPQQPARGRETPHGILRGRR